MAFYLLRRAGHGKEACEAIRDRSQTGIGVIRLGGRKSKYPRNVEGLIRWGCATPVREFNGVVLNTPGAIGKTSNKGKFRMELSLKDLAPMTWEYRAAIQPNDFPVVVRPALHQGGNDFYVVRNREELEAAWRRVGAGGYASKLVEKGAEYRVFVVQGRVAAIAQKTPPQDKEQHAWNHQYGCVFSNVRFNDWPLRVCKAAVEGFKLSGLDFGAVDVIVDRGGKCYVLEINTAPALESEYRSTCLAKCFDWIVKNGKGVIPVTEAKGGALKWVHPAVCEKAIVPKQGEDRAVRAEVNDQPHRIVRNYEPNQYNIVGRRNR